MAATACTSETSLGDCKGVNEVENPNLEYEASAKNIILALVFSETIVVPAVVVLSEYKCPTAAKVDSPN